MTRLLCQVAGAIALVVALTGCATSDRKSPASAVLSVPVPGCPITVDGVLDESCYRRPALVKDFVIAGEPRRQAPATSAWLVYVAQAFGTLVLESPRKPTPD